MGMGVEAELSLPASDSCLLRPASYAKHACILHPHHGRAGYVPGRWSTATCSPTFLPSTRAVRRCVVLLRITPQRLASRLHWAGHARGGCRHPVLRRLITHTCGICNPRAPRAWRSILPAPYAAITRGSSRHMSLGTASVQTGQERIATSPPTMHDNAGDSEDPLRCCALLDALFILLDPAAT